MVISRQKGQDIRSLQGKKLHENFNMTQPKSFCTPPPPWMNNDQSKSLVRCLHLTLQIAFLLEFLWHNMLSETLRLKNSKLNRAYKITSLLDYMRSVTMVFHSVELFVKYAP